MTVRSKTIRRSLALGAGAVLAVAAAAPFARADPQKPFPETSANGHPVLSGWLEDQMQGMVSQCTGDAVPLHYQKPDWKGSPTDAGPATAIPSYVQTAVPMSSGYAEGADTTLSREFGYVFSPEDMNQSTRNPSRYISLDYDNSNDQALAPGITGYKLAVSCADSLSATLQAGTQFTFAPATFKAALSGGVNAAGAYKLSVVYGTFVNPLYEMYMGRPADGGSKSGERFYADTLIWDWYSENTGRVGQSNKMLYDFQGISIYKTSSVTNNNTASLSASLGLSGLLGSANTTIDGSISTSSTFTGNSYKYIIVYDTPTNKEIVDFEPIDDVDKIALSAEKSGRFYLDSKSESSLWLTATDTKTFVETIQYLPAALCDYNSWSLDNANLKFAPGNANASGTGTPTCSFSIIYTPPANVEFQDQSITSDLAMEFTDTAGKDHTLALPIDPFTLVANSTPNIQWLGGSVSPTITQQSPTNASLSWTLYFKLNDPDGLVTSAGQIDTSQIDLAAGCGQTSAASVKPLLSDASTVELVISNQFAGAVAASGKTPMFAQCKLQGAVVYTVKVDGNTKKLHKALTAVPLDFPAPSS